MSLASHAPHLLMEHTRTLARSALGLTEQRPKARRRAGRKHKKREATPVEVSPPVQLDDDDMGWTRVRRKARASSWC